MKKATGILLFVGLAGFAYGLYHLFQLRFAGGDNYPEYSSLRADPLGTKALLESLEPLVTVQRNFRPLTRWGDGTATTALFLGMSPESIRLPPSEWTALETFVRSGGRLVLALFPAYQQRWPGAFPVPGARRPLPPITRTNAPANEPEPFAEVRPVPLTERWSIRYDYVPVERDSKGRYQAALARRRGAPSSLPDELLVHTACTFTGLNADWRVVYARHTPTNDLPVLIERVLGRGTIVLAADSFPFSNEALRREPNEPLLAWLVGANRSVLFDETHLGVTVEPGLAALARQYRLGSPFVALLLLAMLFVWKNATSFLPRTESRRGRMGEAGLDPETAEPSVEGRDAASGFINLLRRHLSPSELMATCLAEWKADHGAAGCPARARWEAMQQRIESENAKEPRQRDPVTYYRELAAILSHRRDYPPSVREPGQAHPPAGPAPTEPLPS